MKTTKFAGIVLAATLAGAGVLTACGSSDEPATNVQPNASAPTTDVTPVVDKTTEPASPSDIVLSPGQAGPVKVGMTKAQVTASGLFETGTETVEGCDPALQWKAPFTEALDVYTLDNGSIASIGVRAAGPETADGIGIGSTLADVLAAYPGSKTVKAGYGQTGVLVNDGDAWIGFLFDAELGDSEPTDTVSFIELTQGEKPSLMRDGC